MATIFFGIVLGFCFGLTGTGGSTLAVPLLVYGLGLAPHQAVCTSMIAIGMMAVLRSVQNLRSGRIDFRAGCVLTATGVMGAPGGAWVGRLLAEKSLLVIFAGIVLVIALRMLLQPAPSRRSPPSSGRMRISLERGEPSSFVPEIAPLSIFTLSLTGAATGFLAGLLGVGGGFVIVPALVLFCGMEIHVAIGTSMFSIALIAVAAMAGHWFAGQRPPLDTVAFFTLGGLLGLAPGALAARRLSGPKLQRVFSLALLALAGFIIIRSLV
jgi:uncharacterized membrane protein YfcA